MPTPRPHRCLLPLLLLAAAPHAAPHAAAAAFVFPRARKSSDAYACYRYAETPRDATEGDANQNRPSTSSARSGPSGSGPRRRDQEVTTGRNDGKKGDGGGKIRPVRRRTRRDLIRAAASGALAGTMGFPDGGAMSDVANAGGSIADPTGIDKRTYFQRFPTLFDPLYGTATRVTIKRQIASDVWALEQNLELGPLQTPLRCVVVRLNDGTLWVHAPLAPTVEFFELVESCAGVGAPDGAGVGGSPSSSVVAHVVVPTYALEHKVFVRDALARWPHAKLWTAPGQFSFPVRSVPDEFVWGRSVDGVLYGSDEDESVVSSTHHRVPWTDEVQYETLAAGTFDVGSAPVTFYETVFYHKSSRTLIVTDCVARVPMTPPALNRPENLLLVSKRSTADRLPPDTDEARQVGWEKTSLLVSYFFPEHEELDPDAGFGVVTWTDGWHDNFLALAGRLIVPPVVRTLIYAQNPGEVRRWVNRVAGRWGFVRIVPAHWEAPIEASPRDFERAFAFLEDDSIDAFPLNDLERGLKPIADIALKKLAK